jgi:hypothetical protein
MLVVVGTNFWVQDIFPHDKCLCNEGQKECKDQEVDSNK